MAYISALVALAALIGLVLFQIALIVGAPIGKFAWGGNNTTLPTRLRIASFTSIILYAIFAMFVAAKAGLIDTIDNQRVIDTGMWVFTIYFFIGIAMNAISRSKPERNLMTPVAATLAISFLIVTLS